MADIIAVSEAVVVRVKSVLPDWKSFWFEPNPIPLPAICVTPDVKFADYENVQQSSYTMWSLWLGLYVPAIDQEAGRRAMGGLTDPRGPLISGLKDLLDNFNDDLSRIASEVHVTVGKGWTPMVRNQARFLYAQLGLVVGAN